MNSQEFTPADSDLGDKWADDMEMNESSNQTLGLGKREDVLGDTGQRRDREFSYDAFNRRRGDRGYIEISCKSFDINYI